MTYLQIEVKVNLKSTINSTMRSVIIYSPPVLEIIKLNLLEISPFSGVINGDPKQLPSERERNAQFY